MTRGAALRGSSRLVIVVVIALVAATQAHAQDAPPASAQLAEVRELALRANYRTALPAAQALLARTDLDAETRNEALEVLATIHLAMRDEAAAREALATLYARDPAHRLHDPDASPVVQSAFARARESAMPLAITIDHTPPAGERRTAPEITARVVDHADAVHEIRLAHRARGASRASIVVLALDAEGTASGRIALPSDDAAQTIEYWIEAAAPSGHVLARVGSPEAPLVVEVPAAAPVVVASAATTVEEHDRGEAPSGDVTGEWWFWTLIGVAVVGAGVGIGVGVAVASEGPSDGSLGNVTLPLLAF
ncbi:hypothetical protein [Sandaracinus amylolyticus]|uniref:hypothetical protein n=1 Tax=Sandaracinus amylolyticus TaxID=927083 RepID=UPI001F24B16E|nr:hypothetical protein [Sandaracinus amylolyticus]UJR86309.1 Hypothetical protein I5071_83930 [Sandaracinus amylolyticus]